MNTHAQKIVVNEDDVAYAHEVQQTHSKSKVSTVTDTSKDLHSNSYAKKGVLSLQLKIARTEMCQLLFCWLLLSVSAPKMKPQES